MLFRDQQHGRRLRLRRHFAGFPVSRCCQSCPDARLGIARAHAVQAQKPFAAGRPDGGMLDIHAVFDGVALPSQGGEEAVISEALRDGGVDVLADKATDRALAALLGVPFRIVLSVSVRLSDG